MNQVFLMGRLTRDPDVRTSGSGNPYARYSLAVDRRGVPQNGDQQTADFINCVVFGRGAEFAQNYLHKGSKIVVNGRLQTGSYTNRDGIRVNTMDVIVDSQEFADSRASQNAGGSNGGYNRGGDQGMGGNFMPIDDDGMDLPFI